MSVDVQTVKGHTDILAVIGARVALKQRGSEWWGCCPFHEEVDPSFHVVPEKGYFKCFGCGRDGDAIEFIKLYEHCDFKQAVNTLSETAGLVDRQYILAPPQKSKKASKEMPDYFAQYVNDLRPLHGSPGESYLAGRGIDISLAVAAGVTYHPFFIDRPAVVFPLVEMDGTKVALQGRYIDGRTNPRMKIVKKYYKSVAPHGGVFAIPDAFENPYRVFVEGPIDALSLAMCGTPSIALCGAQNRPDWLVHACRSAQLILIGLDTDAGGEEGAQGLRDILAPAGVQFKRLRTLAPGVDWNAALMQYGLDVLRVNLQQKIALVVSQSMPNALYQPLASTGNTSAAAVGDHVADCFGRWEGELLAIHPPDYSGDCPGGWAEICTSEGEYGTADLRYLVARDGHPLAPWWPGPAVESVAVMRTPKEERIAHAHHRD